MTTGRSEAENFSRIRRRTSVAVHARHHHVEKHAVEGLLVDKPQSLGAAIGFDRLKAASLKAAREHVAIVGKIVDDQQSSRGKTVSVRVRLARRQCGCWEAWHECQLSLDILGGRADRHCGFQVLSQSIRVEPQDGGDTNREAGAMAEFALGENASAHHRAKLLTQSESQAGALALARLARIHLLEVLKEGLQILRRNSDPGVLTSISIQSPASVQNRRAERLITPRDVNFAALLIRLRIA